MGQCRLIFLLYQPQPHLKCMLGLVQDLASGTVSGAVSAWNSPPAPHLAGSFSSFRPKLSETNAKCSFLTIFFRAGLCYHPDCGLSSNCITFNCCLFTYYCLFSLRLNPRRVVWSLSCSLLLPSALRVVFHNRPLSAVCKMNE